MSALTHLLFDCDGTLVDSERLAMAEMRRAGQRLGLALSELDCQRLFLGQTRAHSLQRFAELYGAALPEDFAAELAAAIRRRLEDELQPVPGVMAALAQLPQRLCLVSNGNPAHVAFVLAKTGLSEPFSGQCYSPIPPCEPKPSPMLYRQTMTRLGVPPHHCLAIEDSVTGVMAATTAGVTTLGFANLASPAELQAAGAAAIFHDMAALPELVERFGMDVSVLASTLAGGACARSVARRGVVRSSHLKDGYARCKAAILR